MNKGSFSVEAAIVMPMILFIILSVTFFGFYLRDIIVIESAGRAFLMESRDDELVSSGSEVEKRRQLINDVLWWGELTDFKVKDKARQIALLQKSFTFLPIITERIFFILSPILFPSIYILDSLHTTYKRLWTHR